MFAMLGSAPMVGDRLTPFSMNRVSGPSYAWAPGRTTVITCCAFWCDTWKDQLPRLGQAKRVLAGVPVDFLTVSIDGRWTERGRAASVGTNLTDSGGYWSKQLGIDRVPLTFIVDPTGTVTWTSSGVLRSQDVVTAVRSTLTARKEAGVVYFTFDDFPSEKGSDELLDALRLAHVPATFFCVCSRAASRSDVMRRAVTEGHRLQIHAWNHDEPKTDLDRCRAALSQFGPAPTLWRPAGSEQLRGLSGVVAIHNVADPYDYQRPGVEEIVRRVSNQIHDGTVIQLHAGVEATVRAIPELATSLRKRGFKFAVL